MTAEKQAHKCAHPACSCSATSEKYCSAQREVMAKNAESRLRVRPSRVPRPRSFSPRHWSLNVAEDNGANSQAERSVFAKPSNELAKGFDGANRSQGEQLCAEGSPDGRQAIEQLPAAAAGEERRQGLRAVREPDRRITWSERRGNEVSLRLRADTLSVRRRADMFPPLL